MKSMKVGNIFFQEYFLQYFEGYLRVPFFHLINWDNDGGSE